MEAAKDFLKKTTLRAIVAKKGERELVTVKTTSTVEEALALLDKHKLLSLPVVEEKDPSRFVSILNLADILIAVSFQQCFEKYSEQKGQAINEEQFKGSLKTEIFSAPVKDLLGISTESMSLWLFEDSVTLDRLSEMMSKGVHRGLVVPAGSAPSIVAGDSKPSAEVPAHTGPIVVTPSSLETEGSPAPALSKPTYVSQSDIITYIAGHREDLSAILGKTLSEVSLAPADAKDAKPIVSMKANESALVGFRRLLHWRIGELSALPIVGDSGAVIATLSASDLRGLNKDNLHLLLLPVLDFLVRLNGSLKQVVTCKASDTIEAVIGKILAARVHRAWLVDAEVKPVAPISMTDIVRLFYVPTPAE